MKNLKSTIISTSLALSILTNANANDIDTVVNLTATSNYVARGMTQTNDKAAIFGEFITSYNGFFSGIWTSNIDFEGLTASREFDIYAGYGKNIAGFDTTLTYTKYVYPNTDDLLNYDEAELKIIYPIGKFSLGGKYALATYTEHNGEKYNYYEGLASYDFDILKLNTNAGSLENIGDNYSIGISKLFDLSKGSLNLELIYTEFTSDISKNNDQNNLYAKITYSF